MFEPSEHPQPLLCGMATTPSTFGNFSREYCVNSAIIAICCDSWLAHMLVGTIEHEVARADAAVGRRKPRNVRRVASAKIVRRRGVCRSAGRSRTTGTSLLMFRTVIGSPSAMPLDVPIGWPYCSTNVARRESGAWRSDGRAPTAPVSVELAPVGHPDPQPGLDGRLDDGHVVLAELTMTAMVANRRRCGVFVCHGDLVLRQAATKLSGRGAADGLASMSDVSRRPAVVEARGTARIVSRMPVLERSSAADPRMTAPQRRVVERRRHRDRRSVDRDQPARGRSDCVFDESRTMSATSSASPWMLNTCAPSGAWSAHAMNAAAVSAT